MVQDVTRPDESESDLEKTAELPVLDVAAYEVRLGSGNTNGQLTNSGVMDAPSEARRSQPMAELPPPETFRDVEAWVAAQDSRSRTHERVLAELQAARSDSQARADSLTLELEGAQKALHTALCRANDGERAALESDVRARAAEGRIVELQTKLEAARQELATTAARVSATTAELALTNESVATKARQQDEMRRQHTELVQTLAERSDRITQVESELANLRAHIAEANRELAQRTEHIAAIQQENESRQVAANALAHERDALAMRSASLMENVQSNEWKRNVWETVWYDLEAQLVDARALLGRVEAERAGLAATVENVNGMLVEREAAIAQLEAESAGQRVAFSELVATRSRERENYAVSTQALHLHGEKLATEIQELEERCRHSTELVTARELELLETRTARTALEEALRTVQSSESARAARVAELEALTRNLEQALQAQTEASKLANAAIEARDRELAEEHARAGTLEVQTEAAIRQATDLQAVARSTETTLNIQREQLATSQARLADLECEAMRHSERLVHVQGELVRTTTRAEQAEGLQHLAENELERVRTALQHETERVVTLDDTQRKLALELERTRGALDERELQLRRLERYATSTSQVLSRIRIGIERGNNDPSSETLEFPDAGATLVPIDDGDAPALPLGRRTTIGRATESDLRLTDSSVSRRHAVLMIGSKGAFIEDLQSVNGVTVNRRRIRHARLADGDVVELGVRRFRFTTSWTSKNRGESLPSAE